MTLYAQYDPTQSPAQVTGWYDTGLFDYPALPALTDLLVVTDAQWAARLANPSGWAVSGGALVAYTPPVPTPTFAQQASAAVSAGLTLTLSGSITLAATVFPTDPASQSKLGAVVTGLGATGAFPGGATSYPMKDAAGAWHTFTVNQYKAVAGAIMTYVAALDLIIDGNPMGATALPPAAVTIQSE
jgi:hypothetical protein